jgi:hypothetical protein
MFVIHAIYYNNKSILCQIINYADHAIEEVLSSPDGDFKTYRYSQMKSKEKTAQ